MKTDFSFYGLIEEDNLFYPFDIYGGAPVENYISIISESEELFIDENYINLIIAEKKEEEVA